MEATATGVRIKKFFDKSQQGYSYEERRELRKSRVRVLVTYSAAIYLFVLGPLAVWLIFSADTVTLPNEQASPPITVLAPNVAAAKDMFLAILPIATGIVTYWFAGRRNT